MPRAEFRKTVEGSVPQLVHALVAGERAAALHARSNHRRPVRRLHGDRRARHAAATAARPRRARLPPIYKAHKWFVTRGDLDYTALWILYAATPLARIEVIGARLLADREVIPQAMALNPAFFKIVYTDLLNAKKTRARRAGGARRHRRLRRRARARTLFALVIDHLREVGEARSASEIESLLQTELRRRAA